MLRLLTLIIATLLAFPLAASAAPGKRVEGVVVQAGEKELIVDLGRERGLPPDARLEVFRKLEVVHPVTRETLVDRFPIGKLRLQRVGETLSIATKWDQLEEAPKAGDFVVWQSEAPVKKSPPEAAEGPQSAPIDEAFAETLGKPIPDRIAIWMSFLEEHPDSPHVGRVAREVEWLRQKLVEERQPVSEEPERDRAEELEDEEKPLEVDGEVFGPKMARTDLPLEIVAVVRQPSNVDQVRLLVRRDDEATYTTVPMSKSGAYAWRTRLDGRWREPGALQYFVEAVRVDGTRQKLGRAGLEVLQVERPVADPARTSDRSRASASVDFVNFSAGDEEDEFLRIESDYRYQTDVWILTAFTVGVGIFDGQGGSVEALDAGEEPSELNLAYGFAEADFGLTEFLGVSGRVLLGNRQSSSQSQFTSSFGFQTELRIGEVDGTRLELGAALTEGIGTEAWIDLVIEAIDRVPMMGEVIVTNLPVGADLGVSLNYGAGYQFTDSFSLMARVGWNARTIDHHGPSIGLGTVITW